MSVKKSDLAGFTDRTIDKWANCIYSGLAAVQIKLKNGEVGYMSKDRFIAEANNWPTSNGKEDGDLQLPADYRLSVKGYWTNLSRPTGLGKVILPGEE